MANLTTTDKQLIVNEGASIPRLQFSHRKHGENQVKITGNNGEAITLDYRVDTIDDVSYDSQQELFDAISSFLIDGGSTGAGVQTVNGISPDGSGNILLSADAIGIEHGQIISTGNGSVSQQIVYDTGNDNITTALVTASNEAAINAGMRSILVSEGIISLTVVMAENNQQLIYNFIAL